MTQMSGVTSRRRRRRCEGRADGGEVAVI